eukprot:4606620-Amphidinium_carterae.1
MSPPDMVFLLHSRFVVLPKKTDVSYAMVCAGDVVLMACKLVQYCFSLCLSLVDWDASSSPKTSIKTPVDCYTHDFDHCPPLFIWFAEFGHCVLLWATESIKSHDNKALVKTHDQRKSIIERPSCMRPRVSRSQCADLSTSLKISEQKFEQTYREEKSFTNTRKQQKQTQ